MFTIQPAVFTCAHFLRWWIIHAFVPSFQPPPVSQQSCQDLVLNEDEKKLLIKEGVTLPSQLPLTKVLSCSPPQCPTLGIHVYDFMLVTRKIRLSFSVWGKDSEENPQEDSQQAVCSGEQEEEERIYRWTGKQVLTGPWIKVHIIALNCTQCNKSHTLFKDRKAEESNHQLVWERNFLYIYIFTNRELFPAQYSSDLGLGRTLLI